MYTPNTELFNIIKLKSTYIKVTSINVRGQPVICDE